MTEFSEKLGANRVALGVAGIIILCMGLDGVVEGATGLPQVLTVEEVADLMRVDRKTAYAAIAEGGVPGVRRIGRCIRVSRDVLLRWLEEGEAKLLRGR